MTKAMTDNEKLARWLGESKVKMTPFGECDYLMPNGGWCSCPEWNPLEDGSQLLLVLEALVKKMDDTLRLELYHGNGQFGCDIVDKDGELISEHRGLPQAVCDAAMAVINSNESE